jgi:hypothetical protein
MQTTPNLLMIRPVNFGFNEETAVNNAFQTHGHSGNAQKKAEEEFDNFVNILCQNKIDVTVIQDTPEPFTPDSIFPNNWISFHKGNEICLYPMFAQNRRKERKPHVIEKIKEKFIIEKTTDLSFYESQNMFLEGTGSMVLDRENKIAYACISPRTTSTVFTDFCEKMNFKGILFFALDDNNHEIYHANVMMCVGDKYAVICLDSIKDGREREIVVKTIEGTGKKIIDISIEQMKHFAGNMLQVSNTDGEKFLVMSSVAYDSLTPKQIASIRNYNRIIHSPLNTIELNGGGSARCMLAEIFLDSRSSQLPKS